LSAKLLYDDVKKCVESFGCELLSKTYGGCKTKLLIKGVCGHEYFVCFDNFRNQEQYTCKNCSLKKLGKEHRLAYDYVYNYIKDHDGILLSKEYAGNSEKLDIKFSCGHTDKRTFAKFKESPYICSRCAGKKQYSIDEIKEICDKNGYILQDNKYINCKTYMTFSDNDGYYYSLTFDFIVNNILNRGCPPAKFGKGNPFTMKNIRVYLQLNHSNYHLEDIELYKNVNKRMTFYDNDGYKYYISFTNLLMGFQNDNYPRMVDQSNRYSIDNIKHWIEINNKPFKLVEGQTYKGARKPLYFKCGKCPSEELPFKSTWIDVARGTLCNFCNNTYIGKCNNLLYWYPDISLEWDYERNYPKRPENVSPHTSVKYWWKCEDCGNSYLMAGSKKCGNEPRGCPVCNESNMEKRIRKTLVKNKVNFIAQKRFDDCRDLFSLPFDFYLPGYNLACEAQGLQHFEIVPHFGGEKEFLKRQYHDQIKRDYCKNNNIRLLEISYLDYKNIENILEETLNLQVRKEV
jgi:hypothetical protein